MNPNPASAGDTYRVPLARPGRSSELTAPGTAVFVAALLSMLMLRTSGAQVGRVFQRTFLQMRIPIPTICFMLGLSYVTRYAGMDATLGYAFANTGAAYPFFAPILGWLGVFLTGTDAGSKRPRSPRPWRSRRVRLPGPRRFFPPPGRRAASDSCVTTPAYLRPARTGASRSSPIGVSHGAPLVERYRPT